MARTGKRGRMTTELEQEFFKVFGIEPKYTYIGYHPLTDEDGVIQPPEYPEILDRKLLEMICIKSKDNNGYRISANNYKSLKEEILKDLIKAYSTYVMCTWEEERADKLKHQIQQLFEEKE